jgi:hypothetical protein
VTCTLTYISKSEVPNSLRGGAFECQDDADLCACRGWTFDDSGPSGRLWAKPGPTIEFDFEPELDRIVEIQRIALLMGDVEFVCPKRPPSPAARGLLASPATQASVSKQYAAVRRSFTTQSRSAHAAASHQRVTELLSTLDLDETRREEALTRINFAADHLLDLVTDVLDISRIEAGALTLHWECRAGSVTSRHRSFLRAHSDRQTTTTPTSSGRRDHRSGTSSGTAGRSR